MLPLRTAGQGRVHYCCDKSLDGRFRLNHRPKIINKGDVAHEGQCERKDSNLQFYTVYVFIRLTSISNKPQNEITSGVSQFRHARTLHVFFKARRLGHGLEPLYMEALTTSYQNYLKGKSCSIPVGILIKSSLVAGAELLAAEAFLLSANSIFSAII